jgi:hypothetical protein
MQRKLFLSQHPVPSFPKKNGVVDNTINKKKTSLVFRYVSMQRKLFLSQHPVPSFPKKNGVVDNTIKTKRKPVWSLAQTVFAIVYQKQRPWSKGCDYVRQNVKRVEIIYTRTYISKKTHALVLRKRISLYTVVIYNEIVWTRKLPKIIVSIPQVDTPSTTGFQTPICSHPHGVLHVGCIVVPDVT